MQRIPGYEIDQILNESERCFVYKGHHLTGTPVIIKTPRGEHPEPRQVAQFQRAFDLGASVAEGVAVKHFDLVHYRSSVALISAEFDGVALHTAIPEGGLRLGPLIGMSLALATQLARLHAAGLLHKNIRPDNILVNLQTYALRFTNLSLAAHYSHESGDVRAPDTMEGGFEYAAPEQLGRLDIGLDERADLYSLGVTLFQMASGTLPFSQTTPSALAYAHAALPAPVLSTLRADLPPVFSDIIARLLEKNVADRYASASGVVRDLQTCATRFNQTGSVRHFAIAANDVSSRFRIPDKLYGRQVPCAQLLKAATQSRQGNKTLVTVAGYSGVGKTALVNSLQRPYTTEGGLFCVGKFDQFHLDRPYLGILKVFRELLRKVLTKPQETLQQFQTKLQEAVGIHGRLLADNLPELTALLGEQPAVDDVAPLDAERRFHGLVIRFFQVFAAPQSPLLVFIDDLQWADPASINLLEAVVASQQLAHLLLIVGYRSNEVGIGHPAQAVLGAMGQNEADVISIELGALTPSDITELVADTLQVAPSEADFLGRHLHQVSAGNVFFAREVLLELRKRKFFRFEEASGEWKWDIGDLSTQAIPDNVASLLTQRLVDLPEACMNMLNTASCVGSDFDLKTLAKVHEISQSAAADLLAPAVLKNLLVSLDANHNMFASLASSDGKQALAASTDTAHYRFQHDQVRLTVHNHQAHAQRAQRHLQIGRLLLRNLATEDLASRAVEVFEHLSADLNLVTEPAERLRFAELGLLAGKSALRGLAFATARTMLQNAASLLTQTAWQSNYLLAMQIHLGLAECAHALENTEEFESSVALVIDHAQSPVDAAQAQGLLLRVRNTQARYTEAVDIAVDAARSLGIKLPRKPTLVHVLVGAGLALWVQGRKKPLDFENHPETADPNLRAAVSLMSQAASSAYFAEPNLLPLIATTCTRLSLKHGVAPSSPYGIAVWGLVLCGVLGRIDTGYEFGELARSIGRRYGGVEEARARFVVNCFIKHWKDPLLDTAALLYKDWGSNRVAGDEESATYCAGVALYTHFLSGVSVDADLRYEGLMGYLESSDKIHVKDCFLAWGQLFETLRSEEISDDLIGSRFNLTEKLPHFEQTKNGVQIATSLMAAAILDYFAGRYERAEARFATAMEWEENLVGQVLVPGLAFFRALNAYRLLAQKPGQRKLLRMARKQTRRLRRWAKFSPYNMDHRVALLDAEALIAEGRTADAVLALHLAVNQAAASGALLYQAMAEQRLAQVHTMAGHALQAQDAGDRARALFTVLGATALTDQTTLKLKLAAHRQLAAQARSTAPVHLDSLNLQSLLEAIRAISSSTSRESLLDRLLSSVVQAAGADRGVLILLDVQQRPVVELVIDADMRISRPCIPLAVYPEIAHPIADLALRMRETVDVQDTRNNEMSIDSPYIVRSRVRSVLASCIFLKEQSIGLLYLESHVATSAFSGLRAEIAQSLGAQAGIALENVRLFQASQNDLAIQTALSLANRRFVPEGFVSGLGHTNVVDVRLNEATERVMNVLFADLRGFTTISNQLGPARTVQMINRYLSHVQPGIAAHDGFVAQYYGDGVLALFPGGAGDAIHAGIAMCRGLDAYNQERGDFPELRFGIGIHRGLVTLGTIGDLDHFQCSVVGDSVNLASRIEALTKFYAATLLVSGTTYGDADSEGRITHRHLGPVQVPGRLEVIDIYECLDAYSESKREQLLSGQETFATAITAYFNGQWTQAKLSFDACTQQCPQDEVSRAFAARCVSRIEHVIEWTGVEQPGKASF